jgi:hypothetical protein
MAVLTSCPTSATKSVDGFLSPILVWQNGGWADNAEVEGFVNGMPFCGAGAPLFNVKGVTQGALTIKAFPSAGHTTAHLCAIAHSLGAGKVPLVSNTSLYIDSNYTAALVGFDNGNFSSAGPKICYLP